MLDTMNLEIQPTLLNSLSPSLFLTPICDFLKENVDKSFLFSLGRSCQHAMRRVGKHDGKHLLSLPRRARDHSPDTDPFHDPRSQERSGTKSRRNQMCL